MMATLRCWVDVVSLMDEYLGLTKNEIANLNHLYEKNFICSVYFPTVSPGLAQWLSLQESAVVQGGQIPAFACLLPLWGSVGIDFELSAGLYGTFLKRDLRIGRLDSVNIFFISEARD